MFGDVIEGAWIEPGVCDDCGGRQNALGACEACIIEVEHRRMHKVLIPKGWRGRRR